MKLSRTPMMLLLGLFAGVCSGVLGIHSTISSRIIVPSFILIAFMSLPYQPFHRWWILRFLGTLIASFVAHFALFGLMVSVSDSSGAAEFAATWGAMTGTIASFVLIFGFVCSFDTTDKLSTIVVGTLLGGVSASATSVLLMDAVVLPLPWQIRVICAYVFWHGALGCSLDRAYVQTAGRYSKLSGPAADGESKNNDLHSRPH